MVGWKHIPNISPTYPQHISLNTSITVPSQGRRGRVFLNVPMFGINSSHLRGGKIDHCGKDIPFGLRGGCHNSFYVHPYWGKKISPILTSCAYVFIQGCLKPPTFVADPKALLEISLMFWRFSAICNPWEVNYEN